MIVIPGSESKFSQPNTSDLFGNVQYSKNMNFDESGYAKLSSRSAMISSEKIDADIGMPLAFGRSLGVDFFVVTNDNAIDITVADNELSATEDTGTNNPQGTFDSWGKFYNNRWYATTATTAVYKTTSGGNWTTTGISLTTAKSHVMEAFLNRVELSIADGNTVSNYNTSHVAQGTVTIPADYEVVGLSYSSNQMGIVTQLSDTGIIGKNQEAIFCIWDGVSTSAGDFTPTGTDMVVAIKAFMGSWAILTRTGELKFWNGGSFGAFPNGDTPVLPFALKELIWGDPRNREAAGEIMQVDGDTLLININSAFSAYGRRAEQILSVQPGGVWCYDPKVGLYHKYSPSASQAWMIEVATGGVNTTTNIITRTSGTIPTTGNPIKYTSNADDLIGGLVIDTVYYVIRHNATTFSLATTRENAVNDNRVDLTAQAVGSSYLMALDMVDYGARFMARTGGIALVGENMYTADHIIFGQETFDYESTADYGVTDITVSAFENRGYMVTPKIFSQQMEDNTQKLFLSFRTLKNEDAIVLKVKSRDIYGLPVSTPQSNKSCTWTSTNTFTTTANLSDVATYLAASSDNECEVEVISGAGAGTMVQISQISLLAGTYTVVLAEEVNGAAATRLCNVLIENWKVLKTSENAAIVNASSAENEKGWAEYSINKESKWQMYKVELRGAGTTFENSKIVSKTHIPAEVQEYVPRGRQ